ncbi:MAG: glycerophosphodiester phosphodiesterase family protein [Halofilum sp. (in: g-proteobacteria)]|nr:glycerophosphodiester phosphodiesterase family protein [Halofilum sp. (in: g-proteobacteria)]
MRPAASATDSLPTEVLMAHRGYPARYPENSLAGMRAALEAGALMVEFDVQLTADGVPVVIHDEGLERTAGSEGSVLDLLAAALPGIDVSEAARFGDRHRQTPLPTLDEMLALIDEYPRVVAFVELKRASMRRFGRRALVDAVMQRVGRHRRRVVISYDAEMVAMARAAGALRIGWVTGSFDAANERSARELQPEFVFCSAEIVPAEGRPFWTGSWQWVVYDVNDPVLARDLLARGADLIETDRIVDFLGQGDDDH